MRVALDGDPDRLREPQPQRYGVGLHGYAVVVDEDGRPIEQAAVPLRLRYAKAVRVSVEGNAHFCRGLLATRYDDEPLSTHITDTRRAS